MKVYLNSLNKQILSVYYSMSYRLWDAVINKTERVPVTIEPMFKWQGKDTKENKFMFKTKINLGSE